MTSRDINIRQRRPAGPDRDALTAQVLGFLATDPDRLGRFLALTGFDPAGLRTAAARPDFAAAVLGYLAEDESLLIAFAQGAGLDPAWVGVQARAASEAPVPDD